MRFSRLLVAGTMLTMVPSGAAFAQTTVPPARTVQTLLESCTSQDKSFMMRCNAYLAGVADGMDFLAAFQKVNGAALTKAKLTLRPFAFCHNQPWTAETLRQTFTTWANANPKRMQDDQYVAAVDALHDSFPCK